MKTEYATKTDVEKIVRGSTDEIMGILQTFIMQVDERFNVIEHDTADIKATLNRRLDVGVPLENL